MTAFATAGKSADAFEAALNAKDAAAIGQVFTPAAEFVNIMGTAVSRQSGRATCRDPAKVQLRWCTSCRPYTGVSRPTCRALSWSARYSE